MPPPLFPGRTVMAKKADYKSIMGGCCAGLWHYLRALWGYGLRLQVIWNSRVKAAPSAAYSSPSLLLAEAGHRAWTPLASSISLKRAVWGAEGPQPRDSAQGSSQHSPLCSMQAAPACCTSQGWGARLCARPDRGKHKDWSTLHRCGKPMHPVLTGTTGSGESSAAER